MQFHIDEPGIARPAAQSIVFCDGSADDSFREGVDLELSHWVPNRTPPQLKADTSTEICMQAVECGAVAGFELAVNNHVDVDGVLSVFTLLEPALALRHRQIIVQAAEIGDFYAWGDVVAQKLFQSLALTMGRMRQQGRSIRAIYEQCFERVRLALQDSVGEECLPGIESVARGDQLVSDGTIGRLLLHERFVHYAIPLVTCEQAIARSLRAPAFCQPFSGQSLLSPHVRARRDEQRLQLVSVETASGWFYDLFYPGYAWADVVARWRPPGLRFTLDSNGSLLDHEPLRDSVNRLRELETSGGDWRLVSELKIFSSDIGRPFPIVLSHMRADAPAASELPPRIVAPLLAEAFSRVGSKAALT